MLEQFDKDLMQHIHLENNILFPKANQLQTRKYNSLILWEVELNQKILSDLIVSMKYSRNIPDLKPVNRGDK